ncbi:MAG: AsmA family protein [Candidatus Margulisiibacteriota bacterium]|nr:AsmA family protein [Candidatus Margulisiibacteriota bacterium]
MKKLIKWGSIIVGSLIGLLTIAAIAFPFVFPLEKIKEIATKQISETINREVTIEKVSFNILKGISLEKLSISNRRGFARKPFVSADAIILRYAFWPLFKRQVLVKELRLEKPEILIEKSAGGAYNFSDMTQQRRRPAPKKKEEKAPPFSLIIDTFTIRNGKIIYSDHGTRTSSELKDVKLTVSDITLALIKPIGLDFSSTAVFKEKDIPLSLKGQVETNLKENKFNLPSLSLSIAGEKANISAAVSNLKYGPNINLSITSNSLTLDPLLAIFSAGATKKKEKLPYGVATKNLSRTLASLPSRLKLTGNINIRNLKFQEVKVDKVNIGVSVANKILNADLKEIKAFSGTLSGKARINLAAHGLSYNVSTLKLDNLNAAPFSNAMVETFLTKLSNYKDLTNKVYGTLSARLILSGRGIEVQDIMKNTSARGSFRLVDGELKRLKTIDAIAEKIKTPGLKQDLKISDLSAGFTYQNQVVNIKDLALIDHDIQMGFDGGINLASKTYVSGNRLTIKASPRSTKGLSREYNLLRDDKGWLEMTFELRGSLKKPIPFPILAKAFEKGVEKAKTKVQEKAQEEIDKTKAAAQKKAEEEKKRLEEEAKQKLKEEAEKKAKELFKF